MNEQKNIENRIEQAMNSLDGISSASPGPFFYTRVQARLQKQAASSWESVTSFITRPAVALAGVCIIILLNAVAFYFHPDNTAASVAAVSVSDQVYAEEYGTLASNVLYDENQNPEP